MIKAIKEFIKEFQRMYAWGQCFGLVPIRKVSKRG